MIHIVTVKTYGYLMKPFFKSLVKQSKYVNTVFSTAFHGVFLVNTDRNADELYQIMSKEVAHDGQLLIARLQGDFSGWDKPETLEFLEASEENGDF